MSKLKVLFACILITIVSSSCVSLMLRTLGAYKEEAKIKNIPHKNKNILYIPIHHVGKKSFYEDIRKKVDSLQKLGYVVYEEGVKPIDESLSVTETANLKFRKMMGFYVAQEGYLDTVNNTLFGKISYRNKRGLINQPPYKDLGVDTTKSIRADIEKHILIQKFEEKYGDIKLEQCDLETPLDSTYSLSCREKNRKLRKAFENYVVFELRDEHLLKTVVESPHDMILIIYGSNHLKTLKKNLEKIK